MRNRLCLINIHNMSISSFHFPILIAFVKLIFRPTFLQNIIKKLTVSLHNVLISFILKHAEIIETTLMFNFTTQGEKFHFKLSVNFCSVKCSYTYVFTFHRSQLSSEH